MWRLGSGCGLGWAVPLALSLACQSDVRQGPTDVTPLPPGASDIDAAPMVPVAPPGAVSANCDDITPGAAEARLLTRLQYDNTVRELLGDVSAPAQGFPAENTLLGFGNNAGAHRASLLLAERQLAAAEDLAAAAVARGVDALLQCDAGDRSLGCVTRFVNEFGYRAFRRPLRAGESQPFLDLFAQANTLWGFDKALELVIESFLQSPQLLYRTESLSLDAASAPTPSEQNVLGLDSYQVASRLSYFLWNSMPDSELFALADSGQLEDADTVRAQARRMLDDERARATVADFYEQWLNVASFSGLTRDVPGTTSTSAFNTAWADSLARFVQHTFWEEGGNVASLLGSHSVFAEPALASFYGFSSNPADGPADDSAGASSGPYVDDNRAGILSQPGLMALLAHPDQSAPVQRGKFVREQLLCYQMPPPPPNVDTTPPDPDPNATTRERFKQHTADDGCASCHRFLDATGFGLEGFDQLGRVRTEENGLPVDASGIIVESKDPNLDGAFNGALELSSKLAQSPQVEACLATQWFRYGMGRAEQKSDICSLERVKSVFADSGGDFRELLVALATSDAFRYRAPDEQDL
jgi:Protein of unknown function (DUF1592)/Protein of unknown function (DUF1588)/Protein of unknown function (DUF1585)/Protein of unknown function (DUF1595)/Protein of unknown function (DUF1587)